MPTLRPPGIATPLGDVIAVAVVVLFGVVPFPDETSRAHGPLLAVALLPAAAMPFRRRWPIAALGVSVVCDVVMAFAGVLAPSTLIAVAITTFSVTSRSRRWIGILSVAVATLVVFFVNSVPLGGDLFDSLAMQFVTLIVLAGALGDAARSRREYLTAMMERAERAERGQEDEARRRVAEERVRIARDLHDVVAHQISVISLSAGVASSSLESRPERAREALSNIRSASRTVLTDIGGLMTLLRADDPEDPHGLHPQAGLDSVGDLITRFADVGLRVELEPAQVMPVLSPAVNHVAYLALQEGLTNAHKHGAEGRAAVRLRSGDGEVVLIIANPLGDGPPSTTASGHGLRGLRERVAAVRGRVETAHDAEEFRLEISLPAEETTAR
ncbi:sensor histidine kinase [Microbacterium murale]|uniref:sensor histidine kinase n=1 Tax=Microbacterium murale TaxID=1081040 RepID=UPI0027D8F6FD|nr:histidine kinase [Microbacterium murale]